MKNNTNKGSHTPPAEELGWEKELKPRVTDISGYSKEVRDIVQEILNTYWERLKPNISSLLSKTKQETVAKCLSVLESIEKWPEASKDAGLGGPGPLCTSGILTQYGYDKEKHEKQINDILSRLNEIKQITKP